MMKIDKELDKKLVEILTGAVSQVFNKHAYKRLSKELKEYFDNRFEDSESLNETYARLKYNIEIRPVCPICGGKVHHQRGPVFSKHCGVRCSSLNPESQEKARKLKYERYGSWCNTEKYKETWWSKSKEERDQRYIKVANTRKSLPEERKQEITNKIKETKQDRYGDPNYNNPEKTKETCLRKYGVDNPTKSEIVKNKIKQTFLEKYGVDNPWKSEEIINKIQETKEKLGPEHRREITRKTKQTLLEKYGNENYVNTEKIRETCLKRYGSTAFVNSEKMKQWMIEHPFKGFSKKENKLYEMILEKWPDVIRQYKEERYPWHCDFYIPSLDLFIEYQGMWTHGDHPYDPNNEEDIKSVEHMKSKGTKYYLSAINNWTKLDPKKREVAKQNNLNFEEIWKINEIQNIFNKYGV